MNQKTFNKVLSLYREGAGPETCVSTIIDLGKTTFETAAFIQKFYHKCFIQPLIDEIGGTFYEPPNRERPSDLED